MARDGLEAGAHLCSIVNIHGDEVEILAAPARGVFMRSIMLSTVSRGERAAIRHEEEALLDRMQEVASAARGLPDARTRRPIEWIRDNLCPELPHHDKPSGRGGGTPARWNERRVLIFTENVIGTKRYLREMLEQAIEGSPSGARAGGIMSAVVIVVLPGIGSVARQARP